MKKNKLLYVAMIAAIAGCDLVTSSSDTDTSIPASSQQTTQSSISQGAGTPLSSQQASQLSSQQVVSSSVTTAEALSSSSQSLLSSAIVASSSSVEPLNELTDERDGQVYKTTTIGPQIWMAENLNYDNGDDSYCYDDLDSLCNKYGRLYNWFGATGLEAYEKNELSDVCPTGWHLPQQHEWITLIEYIMETTGKGELEGLDTYYEVGNILKADTGWYVGFSSSGSNGTDDYGFSAQPGGYWSYTKRYYWESFEANWWALPDDLSTDEVKPHYWSIFNQGDKITTWIGVRDNRNSVRCLAD